MNLEQKLKETKSLTEFKERLKEFIIKYKRNSMSLDDWKAPQPVGALAYIDGQDKLVKLILPYLEV